MVQSILLSLILGFSNLVFANSKVLNIGVSAEFENLNPLIGSQAITNYILYLAHRPTVYLTPDLKWKPMIIKELPTLQNKLAKKVGEGLQVTIEFLPELTWGDGKPVTCADLEFTWIVGKNPNVSIPNREPFENIKSITTDPNNPKKCTVEFTKAKFDYFAKVPSPLPAHLERAVFEKYKNKPQGYDQNSLYTKQPNNPGLYYGPYVISEVKLGSHVIFIPNPHYKTKKLYFEKIVIKLIPNNGVLEANLRSGNIDMIASATGLGIDQAVAFDNKVKKENLPYEVIFEDGVVYAHMDFNLDTPIVSDIKVRKAIIHGFNRKEMIKALLEGKGQIANSFVTPNDPWNDSKTPIYEFSRRKATKLLDEAGWKMGADGYRAKNGKRLTINLMGAAGSKLNDLIQAFFQEEMKAIGIEIRLKNEPPRVFFGETVNKRSFEMAMYSWVSIPENSPRSTLHSSSIPSDKNSFAGQNYPGYKSPEVDQLIDQLESELDAQKRAKIGKKIVRKYAEDLPVMPVYYRPNNAVIPKGMKGFRLSGHIFYETLYAEDWSR
jgi:peptide/nickel transport system substrate-binding protein